MLSDNKLKEIILQQKTILSELEAMERSDWNKEMEVLKAQAEHGQKKTLELQERLKQAETENAALKSTLHEHLFNQKAAVINASKQSVEVFFQTGENHELNRLDALESGIKTRIRNMMNELTTNNVPPTDEIFVQLKELLKKSERKISDARAAASLVTPLTEQEQQAYENLRNEPITKEMIRKSNTHNHVERFVGLSLINKLGMFLIVVGVLAVSQYTYLRLDDYGKGSLMFVLGVAMLGIGEFFSRKKPSLFFQGVISGGVAVLYVALSVSFFGLKILGIYPALILCLLITAGAFILSVRHDAQVILTFSLIGGYLPIFAVGDKAIMLYGVLVYLIILNLFTFFMALKKKWKISAFIGLFLNIGVTAMLIFTVPRSENLSMTLAVSFYTFFAFLIYLLVPVMSSYTQKQALKTVDVVLLAINTFFSAAVICTMFYRFQFDDYTGLMAVFFAATYMALGYFSEKKLMSGKDGATLFYLTGFAFVILVVPLQLDVAWLSLGWLAEGVVLASYGILKENRRFKNVGLTIFLFCAIAFIAADVVIYRDALFSYKFLVITAGSLVVLGCLYAKRDLAGIGEKAYKYATTINFWFYIIYICNRIHDVVGTGAIFNVQYLTMALIISLTFVLGYIVAHFPLFTDTGMKVISCVMNGLGMLWLLGLNTFFSPLNQDFGQSGFLEAVLGTVILIVVAMLAVLSLYSMIKTISQQRPGGMEWLPILISAYFLVLLTQSLVFQYRLSPASFAISICYAVAALLFIVWGFTKKLIRLRRFGLGLAVLSVVKLFVMDLYSLTQGYKIISYFALGVTLIGISFVYQHFNKRLDEDVENKTDI